MTYTGIFCTLNDVQYRAGANASAVSKAEAYVNTYVAQAESYINVKTRKNWSNLYATMDVDVRAILSKAASCLAAIDVINYDMTAFNSRSEAELMMTVLYTLAEDCIKCLSDDRGTKFAAAGV